MTRRERTGFAALTGFREVNEGYATPAPEIDRSENTRQRGSSLAGTLLLRPEVPFRWGGRSVVTCSGANGRMKAPECREVAPRLLFARERRSLMRVHQRCSSGNQKRAEEGTTGTSFDKLLPFGALPTSHRPKPCHRQTEHRRACPACPA
jgi:hypothetical protein